MRYLLSCSLLIFGFLDVSVADLLLTSSPDTNGSYCPGTVNFTCVGIDEPFGLGWRVNGSIVDTYAFPNSGMEVFPEVVFVNDIVTITVKNAVITSLSTHNITLLLSGNVSDLLGSTISCRTAIIESEEFIVRSKDFEKPEVNVTRKFGINSYLEQVKINANILNYCDGASYNFLFELVDNVSGNAINQSKSCIGGRNCYAIVMLPNQVSRDKYFFVRISVMDAFGVSKTFIYDDRSIAGSRVNSESVIINFKDCRVSVLCSSSEQGTCIFQYNDSLNSEVEQQEINSSFQLILLPPRTVFIYEVTFHTSSISPYLGNFTTEDYDAKLTAGNMVLISLGIIILVIVIPFLFVGLVLLWIKKLEKKVTICFRILWILALIVAAVGVILWIVVASIVVPQDDTCDASWQSTRDSLVIAALLFSISAFIMATTMFIAIYICKYKLGKFPVQHLDQSPKKSGADVVLDLYGVTKEEYVIDAIGRSKAEGNVSSSGHRAIGESVQEGMLRKKSEITDAIKEKIMEEKNSQIVLDEDGNQYDTTNFQTTSKPSPHLPTAGPSGEYSGLSRPDTKRHTKDTHYQHLHELPVKEPSSQGPPIQNTNSTYGQLNSPGAQNNVSGEKDVQHKVRENRSQAHANEKSQQEKKNKEREKTAENSSTP